MDVDTKLPWCGLYMVVNLNSGMCYIGVTTRSFVKRWREEIRDNPTRSTSKFANAICKLLRNEPSTTFNVISKNQATFGYFHFEKIDEWYNELTLKELHDVEIRAIEIFDSYAHGYNSTKGGEGSLGCKLNDETKLLLSEVVKNRWKNQEYAKKVSEGLKYVWDTNPEMKEKTSEFFKNKWSDLEYKKQQSDSRRAYWNSMTDDDRREKYPHLYVSKTDEQKEAMRKWNIENRPPEFMRRVQAICAEKRKKMVVAYKEGKLYGPYKSIMECSDTLFKKKQYGHITSCLKRKRVHVEGYIFREVSCDDDLEYIKQEMCSSLSKIIISRDDMTREYETIEQLLRDFPDLQRSEIHRAARKCQKHKEYEIEKTPGIEIRLQTDAIGK